MNTQGASYGSQVTGPVLVVGLGATGLSAARHLARRGVRFGVTDSRDEPPRAGELSALGDVPCRFGGFASPLPLSEVAEAVVSPGISLDEPFIGQLRDAGIPIIGDIELFARAINPVPKVAVITGSNGKSTVTALLGAMAERAGRNVAVGGNFGTPALELLDDEVDLYVLELSSFQLELTESLRPAAATVLNVSADHIDRHGDIEHYAALKARALRGARVAVINADDARVVAMPTGEARVLRFSAHAPNGADYGLVRAANGCVRLAHGDKALIDASELRVRGEHNLVNALAAAAMADALGLDTDASVDALRTFEGLPHRCQWVATVDGVDWVDDSKGTNVGAMLASLEGLPGPLVLLAGGQAKGGDFSPVGLVMERKGRAAVLFGEDADRIEVALHPFVPVRRADDMDQAVGLARGLAEPGDTVVLSPGCASFDMFRDYADRGERFVTAVRRLAA